MSGQWTQVCPRKYGTSPTQHMGAYDVYTWRATGFAGISQITRTWSSPILTQCRPNLTKLNLHMSTSHKLSYIHRRGAVQGEYSGNPYAQNTITMSVFDQRNQNLTNNFRNLIQREKASLTPHLHRGFEKSYSIQRSFIGSPCRYRHLVNLEGFLRTKL